MSRTPPANDLPDLDVTPDFDVTDDELRAGGAVKWTLPAPGVLPAWVAEMDVRPCPAVQEALRDALDRGSYGYPAPDAATGLPDATAEFLLRRFGWRVEPHRVVLTGDVMAGVRLVLERVCEGAPVVVPVPSYPPFLDVVPLTGRQLVTVACVRGNGPDGAPRDVLDLDAIDAALARGARTVIISSPYNPLGRAFGRAELEGLRDVLVRRGARVISDEIHAPLVLPGATHIPYLSLDGTAEHATAVVGSSKAWNTPGLKCAQIVAGSAADLVALRGAPLVANHGVASLGIVAALAAYTRGEAWLDGVLAHLDRMRALLGTLLDRYLPHVSCPPLEATYLAWLDASATGLADPTRTALDAGRVMLFPGSHFGPGYEHFTRLNIATSAERLERVVSQLATAWPPAAPAASPPASPPK